MDETTLRVERRSAPRGAVVYVNGRPLTGPDPVASMERRLPDPLTVAPQTLFLILSPLDAYGVAEWISQIPQTCGVLLVEFESRLAELYPRRPGGSDYRRTAQADSWNTAVRTADELIQRQALRRLQTIHLTGGSRLHRARYQDLETHLSRAIQRYWNNRGTQIRLQRRWVANLIRNVAREGLPVTALNGHRGGRAVLVGAGPSLDQHIALLARLFPPGGTPRSSQTRGVLVAIDTALPALAAAQIQPDFIVTMDGQLANAQDFLPWQWDQTAVIADATTHFSIPRRFAPSRRYWFVSRFAPVQLFTDPELAPLFTGIPVLPPFGSVAPAAVHILAQLMGITEILVAGVDFWYRPPRSHAEMSTTDRWRAKRISRLHHRDGHDRALARPIQEVRLRDGTTAAGDAILFGQAQLARDVISRSASQVLQLPGTGLELGATPLSPADVEAWWNAGEVAASDDHPAGPSTADAAHAPRAAHVAGAPDATRATDARTKAVRALLRRLLALEENLQRRDRGAIVDSGLDFTLVDLPQWPLMTLSPQWMEVHRLRILRSVRDYRRRVETLLLRSTPEN